ncbi:hypothetical protein A0H81_11119 [Grifola frondosa]|uniref:Uncharacterized protein n=1 Tax=Grifola frondosa TaxID=5627 RepID=A0A1C7LVF7_GRIFR|nr:hypothetical protein A0H81_11119 [Grifola frondosa]
MSQSQDTPMVDDPAASLRAAALLTLKSKRRKPLSASDAPRPVAVPPSIQLDYGQEEPSGASSIASSPAAPPASIDVDDGQTREEGEISDSELPPARVCKPPRVSPVKIEPTPVMIPPVMTVSTIVAPAVDPSHVRPGLALTQAQYDTAKDIVLDLLGWGVPPEYLISCGLSREVVYYVFVELNLRLPANLDISGIPPYGPPPSSDSTIRSPQVHPSLPQKPSDPQGESVTSPVGASAGVPPVSPSLLDMEQQRRQELLARKAVLASRKLKQQGSLESTASVPTLTTAAVTANIDTVVPTKTVEDFLKTIEPEAASSQSSSRADVSDAMDVDEPIPGLTASDNSMRFSSQPPASSTRSMSISDTVSPTSAVASSFAASVITETPFHRSPVDLVPTNEPTSGKEEDDAMDVIPGLFGDRSGYSAPQPPSAPPRRGGKRPVAADFVDMEPGPSSRTHSSNGFHGSHFFQGVPAVKQAGSPG